VGGINTPLPPDYMLPRQKFNKETSELNDTIDQMDLTDIYGLFHMTAHNIHLLFSAAHGTFNKIDHILG
jgi:hypothetical protein